MHLWHDVAVDEALLAERCPVVIEVPRGSGNTYDRGLYSAVR